MKELTPSAFVQDHLPLYPDMDNTRGKVNIVIFSGEYIWIHLDIRSSSWEPIQPFIINLLDI